MEIPLVLTSPRPDRLIYGLPVWYRAVMGLILAIVIASLAMGEGKPGLIAWLVLLLLLLGALYEDKWTFDAEEGRVVHRAGLIVSARSAVIDFTAIAGFRIVPLVKGTLPGSVEEKRENAAALEGSRVDDGQIARSRHKKPFLSLEIECADGSRYLIDHMPARNGAKLRAIAAQMAALCGKRVSEA